MKMQNTLILEQFMFKGSDKNCDKSQIKYHFINMSIFQFPFTCLGTCCKERIVYCQVKSLEVCTFVTFYLNIFCSQFIFYQGFCKGIQSKLSNHLSALTMHPPNRLQEYQIEKDAKNWHQQKHNGLLNRSTEFPQSD